jgi:sugar/nucleoside kinase (ribokinase family)
LFLLTDVFLPNQTEALAITHASNAETAARQLAAKAGTVVIKMGAAGALSCAKAVVTQSTSISIDIIDSVGAGDSFDAGYLYGFLHNWKAEKSLRLGCVCGALSMRKPGGTIGQPTLEEALEYVPG